MAEEEEGPEVQQGEVEEKPAVSASTRSKESIIRMLTGFVNI